MSERQVVQRQETIKYEGPFNVQELYGFIDHWFGNHRYDLRDQDHNEIASPDGKYIEVALRPWISISHYAKFQFWVDIKMSGIKDIEVTIDGHKKKLQEGKVWIGIRTYMDTDISGLWESNAVYMFFRTFINKYVYKTSYDQYVDHFKGHLGEFKTQVKDFLNLYKKRTEHH